VSNDSWVWVASRVLIAAHEEQLAEHGGGTGVRDMGLFESAVARPLQQAAYGNPDYADLAAAYGYGLARNHPFVDGNKRTAFIAMLLFLELNGWRLDASPEDRVITMLNVAAGALDEAAFAKWTRTHTVAR
jgi:death on curing protein